MLGQRSRVPGALALTLVSACQLVGYGLQGAGEGDASSDAARPDSMSDAGDAASRLMDGSAGDASIPDSGLVEGSVDSSAGSAGSSGDASVDSGVDAARCLDPLETEWWGDRDPDVTCGEGEDCSPVCSGCGTICEFDGVQSGTVKASCEAQSACYLDCNESSDCDLQCAPGAQCWSDCQGGDDCSLNCAPGAYCVLDCIASGTCGISCGAGASCEVDCTGDVDCSEFHCPADSKCLLHCANSGCNLVCEGGNGQSCPNHHVVCNQDCPPGL